MDLFSLSESEETPKLEMGFQLNVLNWNNIIIFFDSLQSAVESFQTALSKVYQKYYDCLLRVDNILADKSEWKRFSHSERKLVENTSRLTGLLFEMCKIEIVKKPVVDNEMETVNINDIKKYEKESQKLLRSVI